MKARTGGLKNDEIVEQDSFRVENSGESETSDDDEEDEEDEEVEVAVNVTKETNETCD